MTDYLRRVLALQFLAVVSPGIVRMMRERDERRARLAVRFRAIESWRRSGGADQVTRLPVRRTI